MWLVLACIIPRICGLTASLPSTDVQAVTSLRLAPVPPVTPRPDRVSHCRQRDGRKHPEHLSARRQSQDAEPNLNLPLPDLAHSTLRQSQRQINQSFFSRQRLPIVAANTVTLHCYTVVPRLPSILFLANRPTDLIYPPPSCRNEHLREICRPSSRRGYAPPVCEPSHRTPSPRWRAPQLTSNRIVRCKTSPPRGSQGCKG